MSNSQLTEPYWLTTYDLSPSKVTKFLISVIALLVAFNLLERAIVYWLNTQGQGEFISIYFNFDREANLPSLYSALALGFSGYLLNTIAAVKRRIRGKYLRHWQALSYIFFFLAIDEACSIHELLIPVMKQVVRAEGLLYFPWVIPAFILVIIFLFAFHKFIFSLPNQTKTLFILAGGIYVFGALGMEVVGGYIADNYGYSTIYGIVSSIEELLEMFGVVIFINALLNYLQFQTPKLGFRFLFNSQKPKS